MPLLQGVLEPGSVAPGFESALEVVYDTHNNADGGGFLGQTSKVGWRGTRDTWQSAYRTPEEVVPIYGGISFTTHPITQIWYPSSATEMYLENGILTRAYNFGENAISYGKMLPETRIEDARAGARRLGGDQLS